MDEPKRHIYSQIAILAEASAAAHKRSVPRFVDWRHAGETFGFEPIERKAFGFNQNLVTLAVTDPEKAEKISQDWPASFGPLFFRVVM